MSNTKNVTSASKTLKEPTFDFSTHRANFVKDFSSLAPKELNLGHAPTGVHSVKVVEGKPVKKK